MIVGRAVRLFGVKGGDGGLVTEREEGVLIGARAPALPAPEKEREEEDREEDAEEGGEE
jgi:hypothetical protein